jgi:hypothetical protein
LPLLEFSWNKSYPDSIRMTPYDFVWKEVDFQFIGLQEGR